MSPIRRLTACTWPNCTNTPAGNFCARCRKRMYRLGLGVTPEDLPPPDVIANLPKLWEQRVAPGWTDAPSATVAPGAPEAEPPPVAEPATSPDALLLASLQHEIGMLRRQVETLRLESEAANEELRLTALAIYGEDHDAHELHKEAAVLRRELLQLRGLDRQQVRQPREIEHFIAGQLLDELQAAADGAPSLQRTVAMLRAVVTGKVPHA